MTLPEKNHLRQFLIFVFALLIPCFVLWGFISTALAAPVIGWTNIIMAAWFPDVVNVVYQQGSEAVLLTHFDDVDGQLVAASDPGAGLGFMVNTRILSYSLPFFTALHFATEKKHYLTNYIWGLLVLYPFFLLGLLSVCLKDLMIILGPVFFDQPAVVVPNPNVIGILYQLNVLIIPTLVPVLLWVWQNRHTPLLQKLLYPGGEPASEESETE